MMEREGGRGGKSKGRCLLRAKKREREKNILERKKCFEEIERERESIERGREGERKSLNC